MIKIKISYRRTDILTDTDILKYYTEQKNNKTKKLREPLNYSGLPLWQNGESLKMV
jgi:hypothetical protein